MYNGGGVIVCIYSFKRVQNNGFSQKPLCIATAHALVYSLLKAAAHNMNLLPDFGENDCHTCVLTNGYIKLCGTVKIFYYIAHYAFGQFLCFIIKTAFYAVRQIIGEYLICLYAKLLYGIYNLVNIYFSHIST